MKSKSDKENKKVPVKKTTKRTAPSASKKQSDNIEDDEDALDEEADALKKKKISPAKRSKSKDMDDDEEDDLDLEDDWNKVDEDDEFDPDFEEFDLPKSKSKKSGGKKGVDDFDLDDDFKNLDLFDDVDDFDDDDDDF